MARLWEPGSGSQDVAARIWWPGSGRQDLEAKMMKKQWLLYEKKDFGKDNDSRNRFVDIGLENVAVAAARVVERPPRCSNKGVQKRRCLQNVCENHFS